MLVLGCGAIGLGAIAAAPLNGAEVTAVDIEREKLRRAEALGAKYAIDSKQENLEARAAQITSNNGFNVVIEAVGLPETFTAAVELVAFAGRVVYIGYAKEPVAYETKFFVSKELDIKGSRNALEDDFQAVINMLSTSGVDVDSLITQRYRLEATGDALRFWDKNPTEVTKILVQV